MQQFHLKSRVRSAIIAGCSGHPIGWTTPWSRQWAVMIPQARIASASLIHYMFCPLLGLLYQHLVFEELTWTSFAGVLNVTGGWDGGEVSKRNWHRCNLYVFTFFRDISSFCGANLRVTLVQQGSMWIPSFLHQLPRFLLVKSRFWWVNMGELMFSPHLPG